MKGMFSCTLVVVAIAVVVVVVVGVVVVVVAVVVEAVVVVVEAVKRCLKITMPVAKLKSQTWKQ